MSYTARPLEQNGKFNCWWASFGGSAPRPKGHSGQFLFHSDACSLGPHSGVNSVDKRWVLAAMFDGQAHAGEQANKTRQSVMIEGDGCLSRSLSLSHFYRSTLQENRNRRLNWTNSFGCIIVLFTILPKDSIRLLVSMSRNSIARLKFNCSSVWAASRSTRSHTHTHLLSLSLSLFWHRHCWPNCCLY